MATQTPNNSNQQASEEQSQNKPKRIRIWLNDESDCYKLLIDPRAVKNWTYVLNYVSKETKARFGPIKKLISLRTMAPVNSFEELDTSGKYVALGYNQKLRIDKDLYRTPSEKETAATKPVKRHYVGEFDSKILPFLKITKKHNLTLVYMAVNGILDGPFKVVFKAVDLKNWNLIKRYVTKVLGVNDGVQNICTVFGEPLHDAKEFQHGCLYVAVPFFERFKAMDYMSLFGEGNKSKLESSYPLEKPNLTKKTAKRKKKSPLSSERRSENCSQEFDSDSDFYTHGEMQSSFMSSSSEDMDSSETIDMGPNPSLLEPYPDSLMQDTKSIVSDGSEDGLIWPSSRLKPTSLSSKQSLPSGCICLKQKRKNELPLLNKRIQRLTRTIKKYERKLMRLQTVSLEKQREENEEEDNGGLDDDDIFEHHRYRTFFRSY